MKVLLSNKSQVLLRKLGLSKEREVVYRHGDLFIAEDCITNEKRKIQSLLEYAIERKGK